MTSVMNNSPTASLNVVFEFLNASLKPEVKECFRVKAIHKDMPDFLAHGSFTLEAYNLVRDSFMRSAGHSPVCRLLEDFCLFHETDRATAMTWAYALHLKEQDVLEALGADYAFNWNGILTEVLPPERDMSITRQDVPEWRNLVVPTDVWAKCQCYGYDSLVVLRGDRLLCDKSIAYYNYHSHNTSWDRAWERYQAGGGHRAFVAGSLNRLPKKESMAGGRKTI